MFNFISGDLDSLIFIRKMIYVRQLKCIKSNNIDKTTVFFGRFYIKKNINNNNKKKTILADGEYESNIKSPHI